MDRGRGYSAGKAEDPCRRANNTGGKEDSVLSKPGTCPRVRRLVGCVGSAVLEAVGDVQIACRDCPGEALHRSELDGPRSTCGLGMLRCCSSLCGAFSTASGTRRRSTQAAVPRMMFFLRLGVDTVALPTLGFPGSNIWLQQCSPFWCAGESTRCVSSPLQFTMRCAYRTGSTSRLRCFIILFRYFFNDNFLKIFPTCLEYRWPAQAGIQLKSLPPCSQLTHIPIRLPASVLGDIG